MKEVRIITASPDMAEEMLRVHYSAVHEGKAGLFYPEEILHEWSSEVTTERAEDLRSRMKTDGAVGVVALKGEVFVGFGIFVPSRCIIGAVYVHASFSGKGTGRLVLTRLEEIARRKGCKKVSLDSSLNAGGFYLSNGYEIIDEGTHSLPSGAKMECLMMEKVLGER